MKQNLKHFKPANKIQDLQYFGEFGGVNPSISDSSTYTFLSAKRLFDTFEGNADGCYLYSRQLNIQRNSGGRTIRNGLKPRIDSLLYWIG